MSESNLQDDPLLYSLPVRDGYRFAGSAALQQFLRSTSFGAVYVGFHYEYKTHVAVELLSIPEQVDADAFFRFFSEDMSVVAGLSHPGLVTVFDIERYGNLVALTGEYIQGELLSEYISRSGGKLAPDAAVKICTVVAETLGEAHKFGIVHGDVNPTKVIVTSEGVKLGDLGFIAAYYNAFYQHDIPAGCLAGTPQYMSPEHLVSVGRLMPASDVWSLGITLFELMAGRLPWDTADFDTLNRSIRIHHPPDLRLLAPNASEPLIRVVMQTLEKDPSKRFPDGNALAAALQSAAGVEGPVTEVPADSDTETITAVERNSRPPRSLRPGTARFEARQPEPAGGDGIPAGTQETGTIPEESPVEEPAPVAKTSPREIEDKLRKLRMKEYENADLMARNDPESYDVFRAEILEAENLFDGGNPAAADAGLERLEKRLAEMLKGAALFKAKLEELKKEFGGLQRRLEAEHARLEQYNPEGYAACEQAASAAALVLRSGNLEQIGRALDDFRVKLDEEHDKTRRTGQGIHELFAELKRLKETEKRYRDFFRQTENPHYTEFIKESDKLAKLFGYGEYQPDMPERIEALEKTLNAAIEFGRKYWNMGRIHSSEPELLEKFNAVRARASEMETHMLLYNRDGFHIYREKLQLFADVLAGTELDEIISAMRDCIEAFEEAENAVEERQDEFHRLAESFRNIIELEEDNLEILEKFMPGEHQEYCARRDAVREKYRGYIHSPDPGIWTEMKELRETLDLTVKKALEIEKEKNAEARVKIAHFEELAKKNPEDEHVTQILRKTRMMLGPPKELEIKLGGGVIIRFILIRSGRFLMGSPENEPKRSEDEYQHPVRLTQSYYMAIYPVTQAQYVKMMGRNPSRTQGENHPVEEITWEQAVEFCRKVSQRSGKPLTLPTEAQWEYAARAGTTSAYFFGETPETLEDYAWYSRNAFQKTHPVGKKKPNPWGLYDIYGNVYEWCRDWYEADYYKNASKNNPSGPNRGDERVLRGGCWHREAKFCRSAARGWNMGVERSSSYGFRPIIIVRGNESQQAT